MLLAGWAAYQQAMVRRLKLARTQFMAASEEAQRQSRRAQESEKMKTAFINSMCHEIRTPLNAINGFSELLLTEQEPAARQAFQAEIWKSTTALTALLENMLELSQLVSSESPLPVAQTDIRLALRRTAGAAKAARRQSGGRIRQRSGNGDRDTHQCLLPDARRRQPAA